MTSAGWLITDLTTGLVDGYYSSNEAALAAKGTWEKRGRIVSLSHKKNPVPLPDVMMMNRHIKLYS